MLAHQKETMRIEIHSEGAPGLDFCEYLTQSDLLDDQIRPLVILVNHPITNALRNCFENYLLEIFP